MRLDDIVESKSRCATERLLFCMQLMRSPTAERLIRSWLICDRFSSYNVKKVARMLENKLFCMGLHGANKDYACINRGANY